MFILKKCRVLEYYPAKHSQIPETPVRQIASSMKLPFWMAMILGFALVSATLMFRLALGFYLGDQPVLILYVIPILVAAYFGGLRVGIATTVFACLLSNYFLLPPIYSFAISRPVNIVQWITLWVIGIVLSLLIAKLHRARESMSRLNMDLKRRLSELETVFDTAPIGLAIADDPEGLNIRGNKTNEQMLGVSSGGQLSKRGPDAAHYRVFQDGVELAVEELPMQRAVRGETVSGQTIEAVGENGRTTFLYCNATPLFNEEGKVRGAVGAFLDISEIKRVEDELRKSEAKFRTIFETNVVPIAYCHTDGRVLDANEAYLRMLGYSKEELRGGKVCWDVITPPEWKQVDETALELLLKRGISRPTEKEYSRRDGTRVPVLIGASNVPENPQHVVAFALDLTELKQAEKALHESERKYRELVQNANSAIVRWRSDGTITFFNEYAQSFFGYREEEVVGKHVGMLVPQKESYGAELSGLVQDIVSHPELYTQYANENIRKDGSRVWMAWTNKMIVGENEEVSEILAVGTDITERRRAEEELARAHDELERRVQERTEELEKALSALAESEARFKEVMDNSPDGVHRRDLVADRYDYLSPAITSLCGYTHEELFGMCLEEVLSLIHPDDLAEVRRNVEECLATEKRRYTLEYRLRHKDGSYRWFSDFITIVEDARGQPAYLVGSVRDVTERKRTEQALRESEERFRLITETIQDVFWMSTPGVGRMLYVSPAYERIWGRTRESLLAEPQSFVDAVHPDDRALVLSELSKHAQGSYECQYRVIQPDGTVRWIDDRGFPILDEAGNVRLMTGVATDITRQKRVEEELSVYTKRLQESNEALQDFASVASHDMQEPLRKVISFGNILKQKCGDALGQGGNEYLDRMLNATERMHALLKSLLEYSRVTTKAEPFTKVDLSVLVREVLSDLEVGIESTGGKVEVGELPVLEADPTQMRQLFQNLIANGLKFHKEGEKPLVKVSSSTDRRGSCRITVEDNGIGFEEKYLDRIFAPFQRLHGRDSQYEGTGMGLAICKKIVERHGGSISARSEPGNGARFVVSFPSAVPPVSE